MFYGHHVGTHSGGKLYKKEILLQHPYPEGMIYEDLAVAYNNSYSFTLSEKEKIKATDDIKLTEIKSN